MMQMRKRTSVFCLVAPERAGDLLGGLVAHFADDPAVTVVVDRRTPRAGRTQADPPAAADKRAVTVTRGLLGALPPELRGAPGDVRFVQRLEPVHRLYADMDMARLLELCAAEDADAVSELLWRVHERVRVRLRRRVAPGALDAAAVEVWGLVLDALAVGAPADGDVAAWIDGIVDRYAPTGSAAAP
jgi:hypothetical protein